MATPHYCYTLPWQVQQTVWDSSANQSRKLTGIVRFMPYKRQVRPIPIAYGCRLYYIRLQAVLHTVAGLQVGHGPADPVVDQGAEVGRRVHVDGA